MKPFKITNLLAVSVMAVAAACSHGTLSSESIEQSIREAEAAVIAGDMTAAQSAASFFTNDTLSHKNMSATQMARLSMVYMMLADSLDQEGNTNRAADLFDMAYKTNSDSARTFYQGVNHEQMQYVETLSNHSANRAHPVDISKLPDEAEADSISLDHDN